MPFGVVRALCAVKHLGAVVADVAYKSIRRRHPHPFRLVRTQKVDGRSGVVVVVSDQETEIMYVSDYAVLPLKAFSLSRW
jgi:hypothetical protein